MSGKTVLFIWYLVLAFIIGTLAQILTGYQKRALLTTFIIGFIGIWLGDWLGNHFALPSILPRFFGISIFWALLMSIGFIILYRFIRGRW